MITIKTFVFNYFGENSYLLYDETGEAVIIDCGCFRKQEEEELTAFIDENKLTLKHNLCTHLHLDHIFGNAFLYETYQLKPEASRLDAENLPSPEDQAKLFGLPQQVKAVPVGHYLTDNEVIRFGNSELKVLALPGHSPGGMVFYNEAQHFLIAGDAVFAGSIGRSDLWGGDMDVLVMAIRKNILTLPDETVIYPGHGEPTTVGTEKKSNPYL